MLSQVFDFKDDLIQRVLGQSMHYLHGYFAVYKPSPTLMENRVRYGLLLTSVLGFAIKTITQDYVLEHLPIREQLLLFDVAVPQNATLPEINASGTSFSSTDGQTQCDSVRAFAPQISTQNSITQEISPNGEQNQAPEEPTPDQALLSEMHLHSEADLYYAKL